MVSKTYHGGAYEGPSILRLFGMDKIKTERRTYKDTVQAMRTTIEQLVKGNLVSKHTSNAVYDLLDETFVPLCDKLHKVLLFVTTDKKFSDAEIKEGIQDCKEYVQLFRDKLANMDVPQLRDMAQNIRPKHHILETHIPEFVERWKSIGRFSESVIETYHHECNKVQNRWAAITNRQQYLRCCNDLDERKFEQAAKDNFLSKNEKKRLKRRDPMNAQPRERGERPSSFIDMCRNNKDL